jgi:hypothetical protein
MLIRTKPFESEPFTHRPLRQVIRSFDSRYCQILGRVLNAWQQAIEKHQVLLSKVSRTRCKAHCNHQA